ncbi:BsuPI-related putative proteinase inhibitor [Paenibacillus melissococcoides]|uniref:SLH domain-containing protein n=1 Tax=Paenibacillus melissococcoides TaxID=2912268 RepID=A0ABM9FY83_9BACL|nr:MULTISPECIES: BsuPI-related putative proteinase inhibitor [Paenibacillus]MEB9894258.1 BsuPI-related putative proteinase inhibitor [Bacillus cereus]CAH8243948.1 BsuPI-related putative proteinase inhibitor [Paenibacillus melissococcoides]CAH8704154.1 BsuPI-related putative proteinase inhibitor [Paenibacillus melissococcoides]CAH8706893.1 BsuPI-related putative proteinase inhibitor [Paenibacillus melissococcoides]GIO80158.1 hypothetical protein J6TS7_37680 [Paenibacillus dendritiformis]
MKQINRLGCGLVLAGMMAALPAGTQAEPRAIEPVNMAIEMNELSRADLAVLLAELFGLETKKTSTAFADAADHWATTQGAIPAVTEAGLMKGTDADHFRPDRSVTYQEMIAALVRGYQLDEMAAPAPEQAKSEPYKSSAWAARYIHTAVSLSLVTDDLDFRKPIPELAAKKLAEQFQDAARISPLESKLEVGRTKQGETLLTFTVTNVSHEELVLPFGSSQRYDFKVTDSAGTVVYQASKDKVYLTVLGEETVLPGKSLTYRETVNLKRGQTYTVEFWLVTEHKAHLKQQIQL